MCFRCGLDIDLLSQGEAGAEAPAIAVRQRGQAGSARHSLDFTDINCRPSNRFSVASDILERAMSLDVKVAVALTPVLFCRDRVRADFMGTGRLPQPYIYRGLDIHVFRAETATGHQGCPSTSTRISRLGCDVRLGEQQAHPPCKPAYTRVIVGNGSYRL